MRSRAGAGLAAALAALLAAGCGGSSPAGGGFAGQTITGAPPAKDFTLTDAETGRRVRLSDYRGQAVLLTFVFTKCPDVCPLIMTNLDAALDKAGPDAARGARIVAVSVDPAGDTPERVREYLRARRLEDRADYLIGGEAELAKVWKAYGIGVEGPPEAREVGHTASVRGIDAAGRQRTIYPQNFSPTVVARDLPGLERG